MRRLLLPLVLLAGCNQQQAQVEPPPTPEQVAAVQAEVTRQDPELSRLHESISELGKAPGPQSPFAALIGKRVMVEGELRGLNSKGLGAHLIAPGGERVFLTGDALQDHANGKSIRIVGMFTKEMMKAAPPDVQGYNESFPYFSIKVESIQPIDEVKQELPVVVEGDAPPK